MFNVSGQNNLFRVFLTVAECGSFTQAAQRLATTSTSVMKQINRLEEEIGVPLLRRTPGGVRLTPAGESLLLDAEEIDGRLSEILLRTRNAGKKEEKQTVRFGISLIHGLTAVRTFFADLPEVGERFELQLVPIPAGRDSWVFDEYFDFIAGTDLAPRQKNMLFYHQKDVRLAVYAPERLFPDGQKALSVKELSLPLLFLPGEGAFPLIDRTAERIRASHPDMRFLREHRQLTSARIAHLAAEGIPFLGPETWGDLHPFLRCIPITDSEPVPFGLISSDRMTPVKEAFLEVWRRGKEAGR